MFPWVSPSDLLTNNEVVLNWPSHCRPNWTRCHAACCSSACKICFYLNNFAIKTHLVPFIREYCQCKKVTRMINKSNWKYICMFLFILLKMLKMFKLKKKSQMFYLIYDKLPFRAHSCVFMPLLYCMIR